MSPNNTGRLPSVKTRWLWIWFWRVTLVVSIFYAWYCFYVPSNSIAWADNYPSAQQQADQSGKPIVLFFTGNWCVPCKIMKRQVWADDDVMKTVNSDFVPVSIDVDDPNNASLLVRYNVGGTPITIVTDPNGKALRWRVGGIGKSDFLKLLQGTTPSTH
ncbi:MAG: thioredoxin family protein [Planctomycetaceae bacterium]|jgi:thioredoxin 1|nr:thioredoxin family protein [Planctomycetaceae bacterium]